MKYLFLPILLLNFLDAYAQDDYIINTSGDTLRGTVALLMPEANKEEVVLKVGKNQVRLASTKFTEIRHDNDTYMSIRYGSKYRIMKQIESGYLSLYTFRFEDSFDFGPLYLQKVTGKGLEIPVLTFKGTMAKFLEECPLIVEGLENKTYHKKNVDELVRGYNKYCLISREEEEQALAQKEAELLAQATRQKELNEEARMLDAKLARIGETQKKLNETYSLLADISDKLKRAETVPSYMIDSLTTQKNYFSGDDSLLNNIIKSLAQDN